jgi:hypothetical protein
MSVPHAQEIAVMPLWKYRPRFRVVREKDWSNKSNAAKGEREA